MFIYSRRQDGDMRDIKNREAFVGSLGFSLNDLILPEQIHGVGISIVGSEDGGKQIAGADGLVGKSNQKDHYILGVLVGDCVPILFFDPKMKIFGTAHAGWKGTLGEISKNVIQKMKILGSDPKDILVSIGPHIGACCYSVSEERAKLFSKKFGTDTGVFLIKENVWYLNLSHANILSMKYMGILSEHIDSVSDCTSCRIDQFFSYRKDNKETFGEIMGVVAWKT